VNTVNTAFVTMPDGGPTVASPKVGDAIRVYGFVPPVRVVEDPDDEPSGGWTVVVRRILRNGQDATVTMTLRLRPGDFEIIPEPVAGGE
jgi:hypothetical protein